MVRQRPSVPAALQCPQELAAKRPAKCFPRMPDTQIARMTCGGQWLTSTRPLGKPRHCAPCPGRNGRRTCSEEESASVAPENLEAARAARGTDRLHVAPWPAVWALMS